MQFSNIILSASLVGLAIGQTPPGFTPVVDQTLSVSYGNNSVSPAGELIPRPETANPPTISSSVFSSTGQAILFLIDLDVPRNGTRVPNLHWFVPGVTGTNSSSTPLTIPAVDASTGASYRQPSPPVGDSGHRYVFLLFTQPTDFIIPAAFTNVSNNRIGFSLDNFVSATGLDVPIAANYIVVQNTTGTATQTFPPSSFTSTPTVGVTPVQTGGAGVRTKMGGLGISIVVTAFWVFGLM